jgi:hypothetical protein
VKRALSACAAVLAFAAAGCGSTTGSGAADPATLAPAATVAYASLELSPRGAEKQGFDAALQVTPLIGAQYSRAANRLRAATGLDQQKDMLAAVGDVGLFVRAVLGLR